MEGITRCRPGSVGRLRLFSSFPLRSRSGAGTAAAAKRDWHAASAAHRVRSAQRWHYPPHVVRRQPMSDYDYNHPDESAGGPGYVFVPGRGILNESVQHANEHLHQRIPRRAMNKTGL